MSVEELMSRCARGRRMHVEEVMGRCTRGNSSSPTPLFPLSKLPFPLPSLSLVSSVLFSPLSSSHPSSLFPLLPLDLPIPPIRLSAASLSVAARSLRLHLVPDLFDSYLADGSPVYLKAFKTLLSLSHHSDLPFPLALAFFRRMPHFGLCPNVPAFNSLLRLPSTPPLAVASLLIDNMKSAGLRPDLASYVIVIKKLSQERGLLAAMKANECSPMWWYTRPSSTERVEKAMRREAARGERSGMGPEWRLDLRERTRKAERAERGRRGEAEGEEEMLRFSRTRRVTRQGGWREQEIPSQEAAAAQGEVEGDQEEMVELVGSVRGLKVRREVMSEDTEEEEAEGRWRWRRRRRRRRREWRLSDCILGSDE